MQGSYVSDHQWLGGYTAEENFCLHALFVWLPRKHLVGSSQLDGVALPWSDPARFFSCSHYVKEDAFRLVQLHVEVGSYMPQRPYGNMGLRAGFEGREESRLALCMFREGRSRPRVGGQPGECAESFEGAR